MTAADPTPGPAPAGASPFNGLIARVKNILLTPKTEWEAIRSEPATLQSLFVPYVLILAAIGPVATFIGQTVFGVQVPFTGISYRPGILPGLSSLVVSYVLSLVMVGVLGLVIEFLAPTFGGTKDRVSAFKVAVYSSTAGWVAGIFGLIPMLSWLAILGGLYGLYLLYLGLPRLMNSPQDKALPFTAVVVLAAIVLFFIVGAIVGAVSSIGRAAPALPAGYPYAETTTTTTTTQQPQFPAFPQQPAQPQQQPQQTFPQQPYGQPQQPAQPGGGK